MAYGLENRPAAARQFRRSSLSLLLSLVTPTLQAQVISDMLIVIDADGRHFVAQHTLATDDELVVTQLPAARVALGSGFAGADRLTFASAHEQNPSQLSLWSGSAWARYRHHYGPGLSESDPGVFELNTRLEHASIQIDQSADVQWSLTWVLPGNAVFTEYMVSEEPSSTIAPSSHDSHGPGDGWQSTGQVLTYRHSGGQLPGLRIRYSMTPPADRDAEPCLDALTNNDRCSADDDGDEVPDFRDICQPPSSAVTALLPPTTATLQRAGDFHAQQLAKRLGCKSADPLVLAGVHFQSEQYYLDVASRLVLDRVAQALQRMPEQRFEIRSHTDNAGRFGVNQRLSENRAKAVRHYLLLVGVHADQLEARGYGESMPVHDNAEAVGRRANRRTELRLLD